MTYLEKLAKESPVDVIFEKIAKGWGGFYHHSGCIQISSEASLAEQKLNLAHELGHALCHKKGCKCFKKDDVVLKEYHAIKFSLQKLLKDKQKTALKEAIEHTEACSVGNYSNLFRYPEYQKAAKKIMKLKLWEKCKKFVAK